MTALSASYEAQRREGELISYRVAALAVIYKGALVGLNVDGFAAPLSVQASRFIGVAYEDGDNGTGNDGSIKVRVLKTGTYLMTCKGAQQHWVGWVMQAEDDHTVYHNPADSAEVGVAVEFVDSGHVRIRIDNYSN